MQKSHIKISISDSKSTYHEMKWQT